MDFRTLIKIISYTILPVLAFFALVFYSLYINEESRKQITYKLEQPNLYLSEVISKSRSSDTEVRYVKTDKGKIVINGKIKCVESDEETITIIFVAYKDSHLMPIKSEVRTKSCDSFLTTQIE